MIDYQINGEVSSSELNDLFSAAWPRHQPREFAAELEHCLAFVCAYEERTLVGFAKLAWDGGMHAFLLDPTVHPRLQGRGIGRSLIERVVAAARTRGVVWIHVDHDPRLSEFYRKCGFVHTEAGLLRVAPDQR